MATIKRKKLKENFKAIKDWDWLESKHSIRKITKLKKP